MRVSLKTETRAPKLAGHQRASSDGNYQQRDQLLPIHGGKITSKSAHATKDFGKLPVISWDRTSKNGFDEILQAREVRNLMLLRDQQLWCALEILELVRSSFVEAA